jgi:hypothetical protein
LFCCCPWGSKVSEERRSRVTCIHSHWPWNGWSAMAYSQPSARQIAGNHDSEKNLSAWQALRRLAISLQKSPFVRTGTVVWRASWLYESDRPV